MSLTLFRRPAAFAATLVLAAGLPGCAVVSVAGAAVGVATSVGSAAVSVGSAAVSVGSTVVSTTAKVAGKAVESAAGPAMPVNPPPTR
jgi:hypothetical protein